MTGSTVALFEKLIQDLQEGRIQISGITKELATVDDTQPGDGWRRVADSGHRRLIIEYADVEVATGAPKGPLEWPT